MPELETTRLHLRPLTLTDLNVHHRIVGNDPQVTFSGEPLTLEQSRSALEKRMRHWEEPGFGMWAVVQKDSGALLVHAGLQLLENTGEVELGYYLGRPAWGQGVATEAGAACVRFGFETLELRQIVAVVRPANGASQKVLSNLGFRYERDAHHYEFDVQLWRLERTRFQPSEVVYRVLL